MKIKLKSFNDILSKNLARILTVFGKIITILCIIVSLSEMYNVSKNTTSTVYEFSIINLLFLPFEFCICVFVHEMGHCISARKYECNIKNIEIDIVGFKGRTNIVNIEKLSYTRRIDVYFSGIMANIEFWIILNGMKYIVPIFWHNRCIEMSFLCTTLIVLNILPLGTTDGTEILKMIRNWKNDKFNKNGEC